MADSFFGFDTSSSNLNQHDDEGGGLEPSEDEYDALNDETFGEGGDDYDWEEQHEEMSAIAEKTKKVIKKNHFDLEASLSHLDLDGDLAQSSFTSSVFQQISTHNTFNAQPQLPPVQNHSLSSTIWGQPDLAVVNGINSTYTQPVPPVFNIKNVCTVEELERNLINQQQQAARSPPRHAPSHSQQGLRQNNHSQGMPGPRQMMGPPPPLGLQHFQQAPPPQQQRNFFQPRFPPVVLQRAQAQPVSQTPAHTQPHHIFNVRQPPPPQGQPPPMHHQQIVAPQGNQLGQINHPMTQINQLRPGMGPHQQLGPPVQMPTPQMKQFGGPMVTNQKQMPLQQNHILKQQVQSQFNHNQPGLQQFRPIANANNHQMQPFSIPPPQIGIPNSVTQPFNQQQQPQKQQSNNLNNSKQSANQPQNKDINSQQPFASKQNITTSQSLVEHIQNTHPMLNPFHHLLGNSYHNASHHPLIGRGGGFFNGQPLHNQIIFSQNSHRFNGLISRNGHMEISQRDEREDIILNGFPMNRDCSDEYAGLMTSREKQWLINIQLMQLNTGTPYMDDYYYTVFLDRKTKLEIKQSSKAHMANQQNHPLYSGGKQDKDKDSNSATRERHNSARAGGEDGTPRTYVPLQFENSLGKLQCGSVTAPRKIIDVDLVGGESESSASGGGQSVSTPLAANTSSSIVHKRHKQLLLDIEALYCLLLRLEEMGDPLAIANALVLKERDEKQKAVLLEQQALDAAEQDSPLSPSACLRQWSDAGDALLRNIESVQQKHKPLPEQAQKKQAVSVLPVQNQSCNLVQKNLLDEDKEELMGRIFAGLLQDDKLPAILSVRKGKSLLIRIVSRAPPPGMPGGSVARWRELWCRILRALPSVARRDARDDDLLPQLLPAFKSHLKKSSGWEMLTEFCRTLEDMFKESVGGSSIHGSGRGSVARSATPIINRCPLHLAIFSKLTLSCIAAMIEKADGLLRSCPDAERCKLWLRFLSGLVIALKSFQSAGAPSPGEPITTQFVRSHVMFMQTHADAAGSVGEFNTEICCEVLIKFIC